MQYRGEWGQKVGAQPFLRMVARTEAGQFGAFFCATCPLDTEQMFCYNTNTEHLFYVEGGADGGQGDLARGYE